MGISNLAVVSSVSGGDMIALSSASLGSDARVPVAVFAQYLQPLLQSPTGFQSLYFQPNSSGQTLNVAPLSQGGNVRLLITPIADYSAMTIVLPATPIDGQLVRITSTHAVTALTVNGNGYNVNAVPSSLVAGGFFNLFFDGVSKSWWREA